MRNQNERLKLSNLKTYSCVDSFDSIPKCKFFYKATIRKKPQ